MISYTVKSIHVAYKDLASPSLVNLLRAHHGFIIYWPMPPYTPQEMQTHPPLHRGNRGGDNKACTSVLY